MESVHATSVCGVAEQVRVVDIRLSRRCYEEIEQHDSGCWLLNLYGVFECRVQDAEHLTKPSSVVSRESVLANPQSVLSRAESAWVRNSRRICVLPVLHAVLSGGGI